MRKVMFYKIKPSLITNKAGAITFLRGRLPALVRLTVLLEFGLAFLKFEASLNGNCFPLCLHTYSVRERTFLSVFQILKMRFAFFSTDMSKSRKKSLAKV